MLGLGFEITNSNGDNYLFNLVNIENEYTYKFNRIFDYLIGNVGTSNPL